MTHHHIERIARQLDQYLEKAFDAKLIQEKEYLLSYRMAMKYPDEEK